MVGFEQHARHLSGGLACLVEVERYRAKVGGGDELTPVELRVTSILREEDGEWRLLHRHADPITTAEAPGSFARAD